MLEDEEGIVFVTWFVDFVFFFWGGVPNILFYADNVGVFGLVVFFFGGGSPTFFVRPDSCRSGTSGFFFLDEGPQLCCLQQIRAGA